MTNVEIDWLEYLVNRFCDTDTHDVELPNIAENWAIVEAADAANIGRTVEEYRADPDHPEFSERPDGETITHHSCSLLPLLLRKAVAELRENAQ
jgi:hypothetical protein